MTNTFTERWHGAEAELAAAKAREMLRYQAAVTLGDFSTACILGGEAMGLFDAVLPAGEIVERIVTDAERALRASARLITG
jgi:nitronate monooxygenase